MCGMTTRTRGATLKNILCLAVGAVGALSGLGLRAAQADQTSGDRPVTVAIAPCRLFDTRSGKPQGPRHTPLTAAETVIFGVRGVNGDCAIPNDALGVVINITAVGGSATSFATIWPTDGAQPTTSNLNWSAGSSPVANGATVKLSAAAGQISVFNSAGTVNLIVDVTGYLVGHNHDDRYYTQDIVDVYFLTKYDASIAFAPLSHTHDGRYFTEAEVTTKLDVADGVGGWVLANGNEQASTTGFTSTRLGLGHYRITLPTGALPGSTLANPVASCMGNPCFAVVTSSLSLSNGGGTYEFKLYLPTAAGGVLMDSDFTFFIAKS